MFLRSHRSAACAIRPIAPIDIEALVPLYLSVFNAPPWNDTWSQTAALERLTDIATHPRFFGLTAHANDDVLGMVLGWSERGVAGWLFHVKEMCVARSSQRTGIGRQLLAALEEALLERDVTNIFLETAIEAPAKRFYAACGFHELAIIAMAKRIAD
jgi:aminoglycoside 6'-N-acetyltransferase I